MAQISLRIDDDVKRSAEQVCADIGMSLSTAINIYLKKLGRERRISFEVKSDPFFLNRLAAVQGASLDLDAMFSIKSLLYKDLILR